MTTSDVANVSKRPYEEIAEGATDRPSDDPAHKRQNLGAAPASMVTSIPVSKADSVVENSNNVLGEQVPTATSNTRSLPVMDEEEMMAMLSAQESGLEAARAGPSLLPSHQDDGPSGNSAGQHETGGDSRRKQQKEKAKQRVKEKYEKSAERYKGKTVREWGSRNDEDGTVGEGSSEADKETRLPKYKCAILLGFSGSGYNGMQMYVISLSIST